MNCKQKLIKIKVKDCKWRCFINYQSLDRDAENKTWVLKIQDQIHSHDVIINSLFYDTHKKHQSKQTKTIELIKTNHLSKLIYQASERMLENILKNNDQKFHLFKKQYYNLISSITWFKEKIITKLLQYLDNSMFIIQIWYFYMLNDANALIQKNIEQIFLLNNYQWELFKRFISDFMMKTDAIFNINALKMLLFVTVNVINTTMIFSVCFSFVISDFEETFNFFIQCMHEELFNDCLFSRIIIVDHIKKLTTSFFISMLEIQLQLCNWHVCENIQARIVKFKVDYFFEHREEIKNVTWQWVKFSTTTELQINRAALLMLLHSSDRDYFWIDWYFKKRQMILCYTWWYHNLETVTSQQNKSLHSILKIIMNSQMSLENVIRFMKFKLKLWYCFIREIDEKSHINRSQVVDFEAFQLLVNHVIIWALEKINSEWIAVKKLATQSITADSCDCDIYIRYELLCRHYFLCVCIQEFSISILLLHSRWWLNESFIASSNWQTKYYDDFINLNDANSMKYHDVDKNKFLHAAVSLQKLHQKLSHQQINLLVNQLFIFHVNVTVIHERLQKMSQRLFMMFSKSSFTRKEVWAELRQKKKHDRVNAQALTAAKAAERDAKQWNAKQRDKQKKNSETAKQRNKQKKNSETENSEATVSLSFNSLSFFVIMMFKSRDRSKGGKNLTSTTTTTTTFNEPSFFFVSSVMTRTTKSDRAVKKTTVWKQKSQSRRCFCDSTLKIVTSKSVRKRSKPNLVTAATLNERESQQKRLIESTFVIE